MPTQQRPAAAVGAFDFATAGRVAFGAGRAAELPDLLAGLGTRVLICTGSDPDRYRHLLRDLRQPADVVTVASEPTVDDARTAAAVARRGGADVVLAIGGGSVLDLGKAVAALAASGADPLDHLEVVGGGRPVTGPVLPCVAVPTTAGTGAEVTANAVLAVPEHRIKVSLRGRPLLPAVAVVDPLLTLGCPPAVTAASGLDALTQCLEPLVSAQANPVTDAIAAEGLRRAASGLRRAHADGSDLAARTDMALCGVLGGMALANAKLGAVHGFAGVIGGRTTAAHGAICAALLAPVVEANVAALRARPDGAWALERYRTAARLLTGDAHADVADGVAWLRQTVTQLGVPGLAGLGVAAADAGEAEAIVTAAAAASSMRGNPVPLDHAQLHAILAAAS